MREEIMKTNDHDQAVAANAATNSEETTVRNSAASLCSSKPLSRRGCLDVDRIGK